VKAGKLRCLAVFQKGRNALFPDVLSTVEMGYNVTHPLSYFIISPKGLDGEALKTYHKVFLEVVKGKKWQDFADQNGFEVDPVGLADLTKELNEWNATYEMLIRELKIEVAK
jgi:tripartite-type tricarboxylate transporter receptor subunit TctC